MRNMLLALLLLLAQSAFAVEVAGIKFEDKAKVGNAELALNGAGLRSRFVVKVYAIGMYLPEKKSAAADVLAAKGAKRMHIVTLRELSAEDFANALVDSIQKNHPDAAMDPLKARVEEFRAAILTLKTANKGAVVQLDWLPEGGTRLTVDGKALGKDIPGEDFYQALLKIWIGGKPAQDDLKEALLGKPQ